MLAVLIVIIGIVLILYGTHRAQNRLVYAGIVVAGIGLILFFLPALL